jgi:hypothetical protein
MRTDPGDIDPALAELMAAQDADELCRMLVTSSWRWPSSSRYREAVELLRQVNGTGTLPGSLTALLLCTCGRWDRVTAKLIAAIADSGLLGDDHLDDLAESLVDDRVVVVYPYAWVSQDWVELDPAGGSQRAVPAGDAVAQDERRLEPPLRRWGAARVLRSDSARLGDLLKRADTLPPRHRDALLHGVLDAAAGLEDGDRRRLVRRALRSGIARVRRAALDQMCELDGAAAARRRACADADATVRAWRPRPPAACGPDPGDALW